MQRTGSVRRLSANEGVDTNRGYTGIPAARALSAQLPR